MTMPVNDLPARMTVTVPRATGPTPAATFRAALRESAGTVLSAVEGASSVVPGGGTVAAAVRGGAAALTDGTAGGAAAAGTAEAPSTSSGGELGGVRDVLRQSADQNTQFLQLQEQLQAENRRYSALSNALKARHETAKNSINNIR